MQRIAFLLVDGFALLSIASALEPFRAANLFSAKPIYDITLLSTSGNRAESSLGAWFDARSYREVEPAFDLIFVVMSGDLPSQYDLALLNWLRQAERNGVALGGISGGAEVLAKAGLLTGRRFTVHWHYYDRFETMPGTWLLERRLFVIDRDRYTCAGGSAPLDMMFSIIARDHGTSFARRISDWYIQTEVRGADAPQRSSLATRYHALPDAVTAAIDMMQTHIADPLNQDQLAELAGLSTRQLQRQFREAVGRSMMDEYRNIRLETGRELIVTTRLPLSDIAQMTGFSSQSHFTDAFKRHYSHAPSSLRRQAQAPSVPE